MPSCVWIIVPTYETRFLTHVDGSLGIEFPEELAEEVLENIQRFLAFHKSQLDMRRHAQLGIGAVPDAEEEGETKAVPQPSIGSHVLGIGGLTPAIVDGLNLNKGDSAFARRPDGTIAFVPKIREKK